MRAAYYSITILFLFVFSTIPAYAGPKARISVGQKNVKCEYKKRKDTWQKTRKRRRKKQGSRDQLQAKATAKEQKEACKSLVPPGTITQLTKIPPLHGFMKSIPSFLNRDVSGTPPTLTEIGNGDPKTLFWNEGVVERIANLEATEDDCNEFYGGENDGESAGLSGCFLAQESAQALENMLASAASICYLKGIPSVTLGEGVSIVSGAENLPDNDLTKIFSSPVGNTSRTILMEITGFEGHGEGEEGGEGESDEVTERIFVQPHNKNRIKKEGKRGQYGYDLFFCRGENFSLTGYEVAMIGKEGRIEVINQGSDSQALYENTISGYLTENKDDSNAITFNPLLPRSATILNIEKDNTFQRNTSLEINAENVLRNKTYFIDNFDDLGQVIIRSYSVLQFDGTNAGDTSFLQGAYKDTKQGFTRDDFTSSVEYRDTQYVSAPNSSYFNLLDEVDLDTDEFYVAPEIEFDPDRFDCNTQADITILVDFSQPALQAITFDCEAGSLQNMNFCWENDDINEAEQNYGPACQEDEEGEE